MAANDPAALIRFGEAIFGRDSVLERMSELQTPTLVLVGAEDKATPPAKARRLAEAVPGARLEEIPGAGHLSTVEQPEAVSRLLLEFLDPERKVGIGAQVLVGHLLHRLLHALEVRLVEDLGLQLLDRALNIGDFPMQQGHVVGGTAGGKRSEEGDNGKQGE